MKALNIQGSADKPRVEFDTNGYLYMGGSSLPENPKEFFSPIMDWLEEYKQQGAQQTQIAFNFEYLNTASTNMMARIIDSLQSATGLNVTWYYSYGDYDMKELGLELLEETEITYSVQEIEE